MTSSPTASMAFMDSAAASALGSGSEPCSRSTISRITRHAIELAPHLAVTAPDLVEAVRIHPVRPEHNVYTDLPVGEFTSTWFSTCDLSVDRGT